MPATDIVLVLVAIVHNQDKGASLRRHFFVMDGNAASLTLQHGQICKTPFCPLTRRDCAVVTGWRAIGAGHDSSGGTTGLQLLCLLQRGAERTVLETDFTGHCPQYSTVPAGGGDRAGWAAPGAAQQFRQHLSAGQKQSSYRSTFQHSKYFCFIDLNSPWSKIRAFTREQ